MAPNVMLPLLLSIRVILHLSPRLVDYCSLAYYSPPTKRRWYANQPVLKPVSQHYCRLALRLRSSENVSTMMPKMMLRPMVVTKMKNDV